MSVVNRVVVLLALCCAAMVPHVAQALRGGGNTAPKVSLSGSVTQAVVPAPVTLTAIASDTHGSIAKVEFYQGATKIGEATRLPYALTYTMTQAATYAFTAIAIDNRGATGVSNAWIVDATMACAANPTSRQSGNWSDPATWPGGCLPKVTDHVMIPAGQAVTYDLSAGSVTEISIYGTLAFSRVKSTQLDVGSLLALSGGALEVGTEAAPIPMGITATIRLADIAGAMYTHIHGQPGSQPVLHAHGGTIDIHGASIQNTWTILTKDVVAGATTITVKDSVNDWKVWDKIIITGTNTVGVRGQTPSDPPMGSFITSAGCDIRTASPDCIDPSAFQVEEVTIASVMGNTITLTAPLKNTHLGTFPRQAAVGLLTHNVVITSKDPAGRGGHVHIASGFVIADTDPLPSVVTNPAIGRISNAEFSNLGRSEPGVYPVHFHRLGNDGKHSYVESSSITHTENLCVRVHTTNFLTIQDNVCYDALGHGYTTEDGTEVYNTFNHNLASRTQHNIPTNPNDASDVNEGSGFWINNPRNYVTNNYAADADAWGYQVDPITVGTAPFRSKVLPIVDQAGNPTAPVAITSLELLSFKGNTSHGNYRGGAEIINLDTDGDNRVVDFHSMDGRGGSIAAFASNLIFDHLYVDSGVAFYTPGNDSPIIILTRAPQHKFVNSHMDSFGTGYQFQGTVLFDNTQVSTIDKLSFGSPMLTVVTGQPRVNGVSVDTQSLAPDSTTQQEVYLFDQDGPGKHLKLIPQGALTPVSRAADALTYIPDRFNGGHCPRLCFQEASFTSPSSTEGPPLRMPVFINAGAFPFTGHEVNPVPRDVVDAEGNRWMADNGYLAGPPGYRIPRYGSRYAAPRWGTHDLGSIYGMAAESDDVAYAPAFWPMEYLIDVPNGIYHVDLHFLESEVTYGVGSRVFNIMIEGATVISNFDVFKEAGGLNIPLVKSFNTTVFDGQLNLEFPTRFGMVSGIAVCPPSYVVAGRCQTN